MRIEASPEVASVREIMETPHDNPARWLLMLTAYLDESWEDVQTHFIVAGFLGDTDQWTAFDPEWREAVGCDAFHARAMDYRSQRTAKWRRMKKINSMLR